MDQPLIYFEAAACVAAFIWYKHLLRNKLGAFLVLLPVICIVEFANALRLLTIEFYDANGQLSKSNNWPYTIIVHPVELSAYCWIFLNYFKEQGKKRLIICLHAVGLAGMIIDLLFIQKFYYLNTYSYILMCMVLFFLAYLYLRNIIYAEVETRLVKLPLFWISIGMLIFFAGEIPLFVFFEYFLAIRDFSFYPAFELTSNILNVIFYSILIIAFYMSKKNVNAK